METLIRKRPNLQVSCVRVLVLMLLSLCRNAFFVVFVLFMRFASDARLSQASKCCSQCEAPSLTPEIVAQFVLLLYISQVDSSFYATTPTAEWRSVSSSNAMMTSHFSPASPGQGKGVRRPLPSRKSVVDNSHVVPQGESNSSGSSRATVITSRSYAYAQS
jgi:hypothetical protein